MLVKSTEKEDHRWDIDRWENDGGRNFYVPF